MWPLQGAAEKQGMLPATQLLILPNGVELAAVKPDAMPHPSARRFSVAADYQTFAEDEKRVLPALKAVAFSRIGHSAWHPQKIVGFIGHVTGAFVSISARRPA